MFEGYSDTQQEERSRVRSIVIIGSVLSALAIAYIYWSYTHSPKYALAFAANAVREHDYYTFEHYVDIESIAEGLLDVTTAEALSGSEDRAGFAQGLLALAKPLIVSTVKSAVRKAIEKGDTEALKQATGGRGQTSIWTSLWTKKASWTTGPSFETITKDGKLAVVRVELPVEGEKERLTLDFKLRDRGDYWQVIEIVNLRELLYRPTKTR